MEGILDSLTNHRVYALAAYALCAAALALFASIRAADAGRSRLPELAAFALLSIGFLVAMRAPSIFFNASLNPDEGQMLASAKKFATDMNTWRSVDPNSGGPLDSMALMWPIVFGQAPGYATGRLTAAAFLALSWLALLFLPSRSGAAVKIGVLASLMLVLGGAQNPDFLHYTSEIVPLTLLAVAAVLIIRAVGKPTGPVQIAVAALLLGLVPFAKLQAAPAALALGLILVLLTARPFSGSRADWRNAAAAVGAAVAPAVLILVPLALSGDFVHFWTGYIEYSLGYMGGGVGALEQTGLAATLFAMKHVLTADRAIAAYLLGMGVLMVLALALSTRAWRRPWPVETVRFVVAAVFLAASFWVVALPQRDFLHYGYFLLFPAAVAALQALDMAAGRARLPALAAPLATIALMAPVAVVGGSAPPRGFNASVTAPESVFGSGDLIGGLPNHGASMLMWGWMPDWYVQSGMVPATRDMQSYTQSLPGPLRPYYRTRMLQDFRRSKPLVVVDAVAPGSFYYKDTGELGLRSFPELHAEVERDYAMVSNSPMGELCPRTYVRKAALAEWQGRYAAIGAVSASGWRVDKGLAAGPERLIDGVIFETCSDSWLLPDGALGSASLTLARPQRPAGVELLNTRGGLSRERAGTRARLTGSLGGVVVWTRPVELRRFPYWTRVPLGDGLGPVDSITIDIEAFAGRGGGLNEVRIVRGPDAAPRAAEPSDGV